MEGAAAWLHARIEMFDPFDGAPPSTVPNAKPLVELTCISLYQRRLGEFPDPRVEAFLDYAARIWERGEFRDEIVRSPEKVRLFGMLYVALELSGKVDHDFHNVLQKVVAHGYATGIEQHPFRDLDLRYMLDLGGYEHCLPSAQDTYRRTSIARRPSPLYFTTLDAYCVTHTLFYLTDFGSVLPEFLTKEELAAVRTYLEWLLALYLCERNWDLVGELLIACLCVQHRPSLFWTGWHAVLRAQRLDGAVPGPDYDSEKYAALPEAQRVRYEFDSNYHTTLVCMLAALLTRSAEVRSPFTGFSA